MHDSFESTPGGPPDDPTPVGSEESTSAAAGPSAVDAVPPARQSGGGCGSAMPQGGEVSVVGIRMHGQARVQQFSSQGYDLDVGTFVVIRGDRGRDICEVVQATTRSRRSCGLSCMRTIVRVATNEDLRLWGETLDAERDAFDWCRDRIRERGLPMRLVKAEQAAESRKLTFQFTADGRVDFRDLVRDLAQHFHARIEMRQIGVRDEAASTGGYGPCGRSLCCSTFLKGFAPISIKMAKAQKLSLNPSKLSGMCGRLKCCLRYEYDAPGGDAALAPEDEPLPPTPNDPAGGLAAPPT
jgi:cell fate regulator YaaT (PSP1 superfamily)